MSGNRRLHNDGRMFRIDADGHQHAGEFFDLVAKLRGVLIERDRVQVDDAENALEIVLDLGPVLERSQIISDVWVSGGLDTGKDSCSHANGGTKSYRKRSDR